MAMHERGRPGAMTLAMQAARIAEGPRVLRLGVIDGTRVVDERIVRDRSAVTVGSDPGCTIAIGGDDAPARFELFSRTDVHHRLHFTDAMHGRVALASGVHTLSQLRERGLAVRGPEGWQLALSDQARGKITVGATTLLFQFVAPPPVTPRAQLPVAIRTRASGRVDWSWNASIAFFACVAFAGAGYLEYGYDPLVGDDAFAELSAPMLRAIVPPAVLEPPAASSEEGMASPPDAPRSRAPSHDAPPATHPASVRPVGSRGPQRAIDAAERAADAAVHALDHSIGFAALTGTLPGVHSARDTLEQGGLMDGSLEALAHSTGVAAAGDPNALRRSTASAVVAGNSLRDGSRLIASRVDPGRAGVSETSDAPVGRLSVTAPPEVDGAGELPPEDIARVIRRNLGGIQQCYTVALRNHPSLAGRLEVHFTIGATGRVLGAPHAEGLADAPEVGHCVDDRIRYLVFPQPHDGSVEAAIPFGFAPGQ